MEKEKTKLLIITGPQGSGNHLFAKIFSMHPAVIGWKMMWKEWQGHHEEPFNEYWQDPTKLKDYELEQHPNYVTSISCPYFKNKEPQIPKYREFIAEAKNKFDEVKVCIIGRDRDIIKKQQTRVRGEPTTMFKEFEQLYKIVDNLQFISHELLFLYGGDYLKTVSENLDFPIAWNHQTLLNDFLKKNPNEKYLLEPEKGDFDDEVKQACTES